MDPEKVFAVNSNPWNNYFRSVYRRLIGTVEMYNWVLNLPNNQLNLTNKDLI